MFPNVRSFKLQRIIQISVFSLLTGCAASIDATKDVQSARNLAQKQLPVVIDESQAWQPGESLSADAALAYAITHDALLKRDLSIIVQRRAEIAQAELPANPTINGAFGIAIDGLSGAPIILQGMQGLSWLWTRPDRIAAAEQTLQQAILTAASRTIEVVADVRTKHLTVSNYATLLELAEQDTTLARRALEITIEHASAGEASGNAIDKARISMLQSEHTSQQAVNKLAIASLELLHAMGCPEVESVLDVIPLQLTNYTDYTDVTLLSFAIEQRLDLATKRAIITKRSAEIGLANPPLISASVMFNENFGDRQAILPGGSITIALDGDAKESVADSKMQQAMFEYIDAMRTVVKEVRTLHESFLSSTLELDIDSQIVRATETSLERAVDANKRGEFHPLQLIPIQRELITAKQHKLQDALIVSTTVIALERAVGGTFTGIYK
ncbi:MAG: TolC family protein [Phycisphaerae bacterium]|nr:TolC family protein [Phycisphaerae bacterium]